MTTKNEKPSAQPGGVAPEVAAGAPGSAFGIVANVGEPDRVLRLGAKCWLVGGTGGEGWYKFRWWGMARNGRMIEKWCPTERFTNFRAAWITPAVRREYPPPAGIYITGTRAEMEDTAKQMNDFRAKLRPLKPRGPDTQNTQGQPTRLEMTNNGNLIKKKVRKPGWLSRLVRAFDWRRKRRYVQIKEARAIREINKAEADLLDMLNSPDSRTRRFANTELYRLRFWRSIYRL